MGEFDSFNFFGSENTMYSAQKTVSFNNKVVTEDTFDAMLKNQKKNEFEEKNMNQ